MISEFRSSIRSLKKLILLYKGTVDQVQKKETRKEIESVFSKGIDLASSIEQLEELYHIVPICHRGYATIITKKKTKKSYNEKGKDLLAKKAKEAKTKKQILRFFDRYGCFASGEINRKIHDLFEREKNIDQEFWDDLETVEKEWYPPSLYSPELKRMEIARETLVLKGKYLIKKYLITPEYEKTKRKTPFPFYLIHI